MHEIRGKYVAALEEIKQLQVLCATVCACLLDVIFNHHCLQSAYASEKTRQTQLLDEVINETQQSVCMPRILMDLINFDSTFITGASVARVDQ